jgi:hypothetical protein
MSSTSVWITSRAALKHRVDTRYALGVPFLPPGLVFPLPRKETPPMPDDPVPPTAALRAWEGAVLAYVADRTRVTLREILVHLGWPQPSQWTMARYKRVAACLHQHGWQRTQLRVHGRHVKGFRRIPTRPAPPPRPAPVPVVPAPQPLPIAPPRTLPRLPCFLCGGLAWESEPTGPRCTRCRNLLPFFTCLRCGSPACWDDHGMPRCVRCTPPPRPLPA